MITRLATGAFLLLAIGSAVSGCHSPGSLCQDTVDKVNALYDRCGYPFRVQLLVDGHPRECGSVSHVSNPDNIVYYCWPWLENVDCGDLIQSDPMMAPELAPDGSCDFGQFESH
jgi:hypothetical protein